MGKVSNTKHPTGPDIIPDVICIQGGGYYITGITGERMECQRMFHAERIRCTWSSL